ncbi:MAG: creatininase family protein [Ardenticatenales bacterium]|nr:creatininase family protein [Ardenticatenales bacterium]
MRPIYLADLSWPDVEEYLTRDDRLLLVTGATEQHGRHLPVGTDNIIPFTLAERLSTRTGIPIAPVMNYGASEAHMAFPGTFSLSTETLQAVYLDLIQSSYRQGWRRLFIMNGHGGNIAAWSWAATVATKVKKDLKLYLSHWWTEARVRDFMREAVGRNEGHAGLEETAMMMAARPYLVRLNEAQGHADISEDIWTHSAEEVRQLIPLGAIGENPAQATTDLGEQLVEHLVREYEALIQGPW